MYVEISTHCMVNIHLVEYNPMKYNPVAILTISQPPHVENTPSCCPEKEAWIVNVVILSYKRTRWTPATSS